MAKRQTRKQDGGKRKHKKGTRKQTPWMKKVMDEKGYLE